MKFDEKLMLFPRLIEKIIGYDKNEEPDEDREHAYYLAQHELLKQFPVLKDDINPDNSLPWSTDIANIWLGSKDCITDVHYDGYDNLYVQVAGVKHVKLVEPRVAAVYRPDQVPVKMAEEGLQMLHEKREQEKKIRTRGCSNTSGSDFALKQGNFVNLKLFEEGSPEIDMKTTYDFFLYPGDVLFIPRFYWHAFKSCERSVSLNFWRSTD